MWVRDPLLLQIFLHGYTNVLETSGNERWSPTPSTLNSTHAAVRPRSGQVSVRFEGFRVWDVKFLGFRAIGCKVKGEGYKVLGIRA